MTLAINIMKKKSSNGALTSESFYDQYNDSQNTSSDRNFDERFNIHGSPNTEIYSQDQGISRRINYSRFEPYDQKRIYLTQTKKIYNLKKQIKKYNKLKLKQLKKKKPKLLNVDYAPEQYSESISGNNNENMKDTNVYPMPKGIFVLSKKHLT